MYTHDLVPASPPSALRVGDYDVDFASLTDAQLAAVGWLSLIRDTDDAPLGYADPVLETRDGQQVAVQYALGTPEERAAETLRQWREATAVDAWQGRGILRGIPVQTDGPLSAFTGCDLYEQVDAFAYAQYRAGNLPGTALEKLRGAGSWKRADPLLVQFGALAGLDDLAIDAWFRAAAGVQ
jgi:hypothetical protein